MQLITRIASAKLEQDG